MEESIGIKISWIKGECPVEAEGTFDGVPFRFRANGSRVAVDIENLTWVGPEYDWPKAGWISEDVAVMHIREAYEAWKVRKRYDSFYCR